MLLTATDALNRTWISAAADFGFLGRTGLFHELNVRKLSTFSPSHGEFLRSGIVVEVLSAGIISYIIYLLSANMLNRSGRGAWKFFELRVEANASHAVRNDLSRAPQESVNFCPLLLGQTSYSGKLIVLVRQPPMNDMSR